MRPELKHFFWILICTKMQITPDTFYRYVIDFSQTIYEEFSNARIRTPEPGLAICLCALPKIEKSKCEFEHSHVFRNTLQHFRSNLRSFFYSLILLRIVPLNCPDACFYKSLFVSSLQVSPLFLGERNRTQPTAQCRTRNAKRSFDASNRISFAPKRDG